MRDYSDKVFSSRERLHAMQVLSFGYVFLVIYQVFSSLQPGIAFNLTYKD